MHAQFRSVLLKYGFSQGKAEICARIFAQNSLEGVYSHGLNRFPVFIEHVKEGLVKTDTEPEVTGRIGQIEQWNGNFAPGMYNATLAMKRAIELAKENGIGAVAIKNTNHWMRGGTYGWQAANAGCIGLCMTNTIANMPPWGGAEPRLGNNPLIISVPYAKGNIVLDIAMSQYSYGKLQEYQLKNELLPFAGGYDAQGQLTNDPSAIRSSMRVLPIGFWKGSGLSLMLDLLVSLLSEGRSTASISNTSKEYGLSQFFLCMYQDQWDEALIDEIIAYTKSSTFAEGGQGLRYPGEGTARTRAQNLKEGIPVNEEIWEKVVSEV